jgi:hypothetical protein
LTPDSCNSVSACSKCAADLLHMRVVAADSCDSERRSLNGMDKLVPHHELEAQAEPRRNRERHEEILRWTKATLWLTAVGVFAAIVAAVAAVLVLFA